MPQNLLTESNIVKSITCDRPQNDYFPLSNLSSVEPVPAFLTGFVVENYVKPPVNVSIDLLRLLRFDCLKSIDLDLRVGSQRSTGLEIYVGTHSSKDMLTKLTGYVDQDNSVPSIVKISVENPDSSTPGVDVRRLRAVRRQIVAFKSLVVRITRSKGCPCISSVTIMCNLQQEMRLAPVTSLVNKSPCLPVVPEPGKKGGNELNPDASQSQGDQGHDTADIPEEFFDQITHEIMTLPVLLPGGKSVDRSTLERVIKEQGQTGRVPTDPFTGIPFSAASAPLPNSSLKQRMDEYWTQQPEHARKENVGRTLCGPNFTALPLTNTERKRRLRAGESLSGEPMRKYSPRSRTNVEDDTERASDLQAVLSNRPSFL